MRVMWSKHFRSCACHTALAIMPYNQRTSAQLLSPDPTPRKNPKIIGVGNVPPSERPSYVHADGTVPGESFEYGMHDYHTHPPTLTPGDQTRSTL